MQTPAPDRAQALADAIMLTVRAEAQKLAADPREIMTAINYAHARTLVAIKPPSQPLKPFRTAAAEMLSRSVSMLHKAQIIAAQEKAQNAERQTSAVIQPPVADVPPSPPKKRRWWFFNLLIIPVMFAGWKAAAYAQAVIFGS